MSGYKVSSDKAIRPCGPEEAGWVISTHGLVYAGEFGFDPDFELSIAAKISGFFSKPDTFKTLWIYKFGSERAGSLGVSAQDSNTAFLNFLLVLPGFRGQGIAEELIEKAIRHAGKHGFSTVRLETYSCLSMARKLYKKKGFAIEHPPRAMNKFGMVFNQEFWSIDL